MAQRCTARGRLAALVITAAALFAATPAIGATDVADVGTIDQAAIGALPQFQAANRQLNSYGENLRKQYLGRAQHASQPEQQRLGEEFQRKIADKQRQVLGPIFGKAQVAIASVASSKNLSVVLDRRMVVVGGQDITGPVKDLLTGVADPVPPVSTPPPSSVGFVDETQISAMPKVKNAQDAFLKFKADQDKGAADKLRGAKTDADRDAILKDYRKTLDDEQAKTLKPAIDQTTAAIAGVARRRKLALVVDRQNVIYGGTDITKDVTDALK